jgi:hypothetical protein
MAAAAHTGGLPTFLHLPPPLLLLLGVGCLQHTLRATLPQSVLLLERGAPPHAAC